MSDMIAARPAPRFALGSALKAALGYVFNDFFGFVRFSWVAFALAILLMVVTVTLAGIVGMRAGETAAHAVLALGTLLGVLFLVGYTIMVSRNFLFGEPSPPIREVYSQVLLRAIGFTAIVAGAAIVFFIPVIIIAVLAATSTMGVVAIVTASIAAVLGMIYISSRLITWIVSAAAGQPLSLRNAWQSTAGAGIKIAIGMIVIGALFGLLDFGVTDGLGLLLGINLGMVELISAGQKLAVILLVLIGKVIVALMQTAATAVFSASVYRQITG